MSNLFLILKKEYFDQIASGEKKTEYRAATSYFERILLGKKKYDTVIFQNGYSANAPRITVEYKGVDLEEIKHPFFGPDPVLVFAISLGQIII